MLIDKPWGDCIKKSAAREATIIEAYRDITGRKSLPKSQQFISMCGSLANKQNKLYANCEPNQLINNKLISKDQYIGVEIDPNIYKKNLSVSNFTLINDDIINVIHKKLRNKQLKPGIINLDTTKSIAIAAPKYLYNTMDAINNIKGFVIIIFNILKQHRFWKINNSWIDIQNYFKNDEFQMLSKGWSDYPIKYEYKGTGRSSSIMATIIFIRKKRVN